MSAGVLTFIILGGIIMIFGLWQGLTNYKLSISTTLLIMFLGAAIGCLSLLFI